MIRANVGLIAREVVGIHGHSDDIPSGSWIAIHDNHAYMHGRCAQVTMMMMFFGQPCTGIHRYSVANSHAGGDNRCMGKIQRPNTSSVSRKPQAATFSPGSMVVVTLCNPRDKFWGMVLALGAEGLSLSGIELASFEDLVLMVKEGESFTPAVVFFPMHRIERIELDLPDGNLSSLSQRFSAQTGLDPAKTLAPPDRSGTNAGDAGRMKIARQLSKGPA